jgi:hypothetical protein
MSLFRVSKQRDRFVIRWIYIIVIITIGLLFLISANPLAKIFEDTILIDIHNVMTGIGISVVGSAAFYLYSILAPWDLIVKESQEDRAALVKEITEAHSKDMQELKSLIQEFSKNAAKPKKTDKSQSRRKRA